MVMKNNGKFKEELTCNFKTDMMNWTNFDSSTQKSKKKKKLFNLIRGKIISNFTNGETFFYQPSDNLAMWPPFLHPSKKGLSFPFSLGKKRTYLETQFKGKFTDFFLKLPGCSLFPYTYM